MPYANLLLSDGSEITIEVLGDGDPTGDEGGDEILAGPDPTIATLEARLQDAVASVQGLVNDFRGGLAGLEVSGVELEVGLSLNAEVGWFIGKAGGQASVVVRTSFDIP